MNSDVKAECLKRMELLNINESAIKRFKDKDIVSVTKVDSNTTKPVSKFSKRLIAILEADVLSKVYHIIEYNNIFYFLAVSNDKSDWKASRKDNKLGFVEVYYYELLEGNDTIGLELKDGKISKIVAKETYANC